MLPEWDFGSDPVKERAFIDWVWVELDRLISLSLSRYETPPSDTDWGFLFEPDAIVKQGGRPANPVVGMNLMVREFGLLRYMFNRYWPSRKRRRNHRASAASIAVARCARALPKDQRTPDRLAVRAELAERVFEEWERGTRSPGRVEAELDIAFLESLPAYRFAR